MRYHEIQQILVLPFWIVEPKVFVGRAVLAQQGRTGIPIAVISSLSFSRDGGVLKLCC